MDLVGHMGSLGRAFIICLDTWVVGTWHFSAIDIEITTHLPTYTLTHKLTQTSKWTHAGTHARTHERRHACIHKYVPLFAFKIHYVICLKSFQFNSQVIIVMLWFLKCCVHGANSLHWFLHYFYFVKILSSQLR